MGLAISFTSDRNALTALLNEVSFIINRQANKKKKTATTTAAAAKMIFRTKLSHFKFVAALVSSSSKAREHRTRNVS